MCSMPERCWVVRADGFGKKPADTALWTGREVVGPLDGDGATPRVRGVDGERLKCIKKLKAARDGRDAERPI